MFCVFCVFCVVQALLYRIGIDVSHPDG